MTMDHWSHFQNEIEEMRIDYQKSGQTQEAVTPAQVKMRQASAPKRPVLRILVVVAFIVAVAYAAVQFSRVGTIHTYGLVTADSTPYFAPFEGMVGELELERGSLVQSGDVLFTLSPIPSETVREAQDSLLSEIERLTEEAVRLKANIVEQAQKEVEYLESIHREEEIRRVAAEATAEIELEKLQGIYNSSQRRADRVASLFAMGAAIQSDVDVTRERADIAYYDYRQAQLALAVAHEQVEVSAAALEKARLELERVTAASAEDVNALDLGKLKLDVAQTRPDDLSVQSLFDGYVMQVGAVNGSRVETGRILATVAARDSIWIEAYVPEKDAAYVRPGGAALIQLAGDSTWIDGMIGNQYGTSVSVPERLQDDLPGQQAGIYVRINLTSLADGSPIVPGGQVRVRIPKN